MEQFEEKRTMFGEACPYCLKVIKGASISATKFNLGVHINKHVRRGESIPSGKK